jgi:PleD family two-component response regulator
VSGCGNLRAILRCPAFRTGFPGATPSRQSFAFGIGASTAQGQGDYAVQTETMQFRCFIIVKSVLIANDQESIRRALCRLFAAQDDFDVCGDAENGLEAIEMAQLLNPDLILLGLSMPVMTGVEAAWS